MAVSTVTEQQIKAYHDLLDQNLRKFRLSIYLCAEAYVANFRIGDPTSVHTGNLFRTYAYSDDENRLNILQKGLEERLPKLKEEDATLYKNLQQLVEHAADAEKGFKACKDADTDEKRRSASEALAAVGKKINVTVKGVIDPRVKELLGQMVALIAIAATIGFLLGGPIGALLFGGGVFAVASMACFAAAAELEFSVNLRTKGASLDGTFHGEAAEVTPTHIAKPK